MCYDKQERLLLFVSFSTNAYTVNQSNTKIQIFSFQCTGGQVRNGKRFYLSVLFGVCHKQRGQASSLPQTAKIKLFPSIFNRLYTRKKTLNLRWTVWEVFCDLFKNQRKRTQNQRAFFAVVVNDILSRYIVQLSFPSAGFMEFLN